ncbi:hypothetical protein [Flavobacterium coralii]|uniref:hypothetical protein n=1 Tax=Flavobacterium coralii TaxID=2838017 RepID=UPI000C5A877C|nr:hypothetical protein [Flavobacterium sp.]|tara:strand:+ start:45078 stop:45473 length:396 start_codon:yes stop_codon:yes gene_type:complete
MKKVFTILVMALSLTASAQLTETESDLNMKYYDMLKMLQNYDGLEELPIPEKMTTVQYKDELQYVYLNYNDRIKIKFFPDNTINITMEKLKAYFSIVAGKLSGYAVIEKDKYYIIEYFDENVGFATNKLKK